MNHAYVDGSFESDLPGEGGEGVGGWGVVLILPGLLPRKLQGQVRAEDNNATEMLAVLEAVRHAPPGAPLTVHSDNSNVVRAVREGARHEVLNTLSGLVRAEALERGIPLRAEREDRQRRHMLTAHELANDARKERAHLARNVMAEAVLDVHTWRPEARVMVRRDGERVTAHVPLEEGAVLPATVQALGVAVQLARPGEVITVRRASPLAMAWWNNPRRALDDASRAALQLLIQDADLRGVQVLFS